MENKERSVVECSKTTAVRLAGMLDMTGASILQTQFGFEVETPKESIYLKFSSNRKDTIMSQVVLNRLFPVDNVVNIALTSWMECVAMIIAEDGLDGVELNDIQLDDLRADYVKKFYCNCNKIYYRLSPGNLINRWIKELSN